MISYDPVNDEGRVPSPCISLCKMNAQTGLCEGCLRTIDEIVQWGAASEEVKRAVWVEIKRREEELF
ncbi:DUF1289 domain-containing protein [Noviherbaspirillum sp. CPCC 100848]|uniref:DUF1289 domain-containing protein n=1 Tax=Noviherbaspirillum album TaxID=3080276 RepID=A0ABU6J622_9BURK|nr:DUF1289 domain-containing protein [Noviherbaspirillum sp. CPCC 100848]MEC4718978.1 DUF1289 domain-containing protein [Noviherbaspirillum sp. CPCC 100848]